MSRSGGVRIIGGRLRGSKLAVPERPGLRPTPDRLRETLFNWLQPVIAGACCLDLFAGSGALGIEALSRGAGTVTFLERDPALADALMANLNRLKQPEGRVVTDDALRFLASVPSPCDVVFVDPPFAQSLWQPAMERLEAGGWLKPAAWIHVESPVGADWTAPDTWQVHREGRAGQVLHVLYRRLQGNPLS